MATLRGDKDSSSWYKSKDKSTEKKSKKSRKGSPKSSASRSPSPQHRRCTEKERNRSRSRSKSTKNKKKQGLSRSSSPLSPPNDEQLRKWGRAAFYDQVEKLMDCVKRAAKAGCDSVLFRIHGPRKPNQLEFSYDESTSISPNDQLDPIHHPKTLGIVDAYALSLKAADDLTEECLNLFTHQTDRKEKAPYTHFYVSWLH